MSARQTTTSSTANTFTRLFVIPKTGTASINGTIAVTGTGTIFIKDYKQGDDIIINNEQRTVSTVTSDTALTVATAFTTTASGVAASVYPAEAKGSNKIFTFVSHSTNTADIFIGESTNSLGDGTDITFLDKSFPISPSQPIGPYVATNAFYLFIASTAASQKLSIIINQ